MKKEQILNRLKEIEGRYMPWPEQVYGEDTFYEDISELIKEIENELTPSTKPDSK